MLKRSIRIHAYMETIHTLWHLSWPHWRDLTWCDLHFLVLPSNILWLSTLARFHFSLVFLKVKQKAEKERKNIRMIIVNDMSRFSISTPFRNQFLIWVSNATVEGSENIFLERVCLKSYTYTIVYLRTYFTLYFLLRTRGLFRPLQCGLAESSRFPV